ncbi:hypothetical protein SOPP22_11640 [Shewanella sp. OPT22]|nr:hypothetical protein SOPP22_11640 [Shewanella sp. OPT22]
MAIKSVAHLEQLIGEGNVLLQKQNSKYTSMIVTLGDTTRTFKIHHSLNFKFTKAARESENLQMRHRFSDFINSSSVSTINRYFRNGHSISQYKQALNKYGSVKMGNGVINQEISEPKEHAHSIELDSQRTPLMSHQIPAESLLNLFKEEMFETENPEYFSPRYAITGHKDEDVQDQFEEQQLERELNMLPDVALTEL